MEYPDLNRPTPQRVWHSILIHLVVAVLAAYLYQAKEKRLVIENQPPSSPISGELFI